MMDSSSFRFSAYADDAGGAELEAEEAEGRRREAGGFEMEFR